MDKKETEYNCQDCDFQANTSHILRNHIIRKHTKTGHMKCFNCDFQYNNFKDLMTHRKQHHTDKTRICKNYSAGKCQFSDSACWWRHEEQAREVCKTCNQTFENKHHMMIHRKNAHRSLRRPCVILRRRDANLMKVPVGFHT